MRIPPKNTILYFTGQHQLCKTYRCNIDNLHDLSGKIYAKVVYSQKDVIATQMKELQSRVSDVLHEGSKSVTVLDEVLLRLLTAFSSS